MSLAVILTLYNFEWTGFGQGDSVSTTINKKDADGNIFETITTKTEPGKTLWDWLSLLGVPLTLALLGYILQQQERDRAEILAREQRKIAADEAKEEILQDYLDRLSSLLVDKNILAIAAISEESIASEQREFLYASIDVIRARTLSILRRFGGDPQKINSVIRFLREAEVFSKANLKLDEADLTKADLKNTDLREIPLSKANLSGADLSGANLLGANLSGADLSGADLSEANLLGANLLGANLSGANLSEAYLEEANLSEAKLYGANLIEAILSEAILSEAILSVADLRRADLIEADLSRADLSRANLSEAILSRADLRGADLRGAILEGANLENIEWDDETQWPTPSEVAKAKNLPEALKQQLGITDTPPPPAPNP